MALSDATAVGPRDCALGIGIPLDVDGFTRDLETASEKHFAKYFKSTNEPEDAREVNAEFYRSAFRAVAGGIDRACVAVEKAGVSVFRNLTLDGLSSMFARSKVVTIFSHWRFLQIDANDILDPAVIVEQLQHPRDEFQAIIRAEVLQRNAGLLDDGTRVEATRLRELLASLLNEIAADANRTYHRPANDGAVSFGLASPRPILHRVMFERAFGDAIRHGRAMELFDGMHTVADFVAAVPPAYDGFLDLTLCHSMILAMAVKRDRPDTTVGFGVYETDLRVRMALYEMAIRRLACRRQPMIDVLTKIATRMAL